MEPGKPSAFYCSQCEASFETRGKRDSHHKKEHQATDKTKLVRRDTTGFFVCKCNLPFSRSASLKRHKETCVIEKPESDSSEESENDVPGPPGPRNRVEMKLDPVYNILVCVPCKIGVGFNHVVGHLKDKHGLKKSLDEVKEDYGLTVNPMDFDGAQIWLNSCSVLKTAVANVPTMSGFYCQLCHYSAVNKGVMHNHFSKSHSEKSLGNSITECQVQSPFKGRLSKYVRVLADPDVPEAAPTSSMDNLRREFKNMLKCRPNSNVVSDTRLLPAFYADVRWDEVMEGEDTKSLFQLAALPTVKKPDHKIIECGRRYIQRVCSELNTKNPVVRRKIMDSCDNAINKDSFEPLQKDTQRGYGNVLGRMVLFYLRLYRSQNDPKANDPDDNDPDDNDPDDNDPKKDTASVIEWSKKYELSASQTACIRELGEVLQSRGVGDPSSLDNSFHRTLKSFFCWEEKRSLMATAHCPVYRFLIVLCLREGGEGFINDRDVTPWISKLLYGIRATVWTDLTKYAPEDTDWHENLTEKMAYLLQQTQTPFGFLYETKRLAWRVAGSASTLPQVAWLDRTAWTALSIHGKRIELAQLGKLCKSLLKKAKKWMDSEVKMGIQGLKDFKWEKFNPPDDMQNVKVGYSFLTASGLDDRSTALVENFLEKNESTKSFFIYGSINGKYSFKRENCLSWVKKAKKLLEMLMVLCHLLGGQPARATELATIRWRNGIEQRGVYWDNETIMLLGNYSKLRGITKRDRLIPRYLPPQLGILMAEYLSIIRPIEIYFAGEFNLPGWSDLRDFLWSDAQKGIWNGDDLSGILKQYTSDGGVPALGFRDYRQVATAFMGKHLKYKVDDEVNNIWDAIYDLQAGHSSRTAGMHYAVASTDHLSVSPDNLFKYLYSSKDWHGLMLGVKAGNFKVRVETIKSQPDPTLKNPAPPGTFELSDELLEFNEEPPRALIRSVQHFPDFMQLKDAAAALRGLRRFFRDDNAQFKSVEQAQAVQLTLTRKSDLLVILPTGGGKSLIFQLPAFIEKSFITVVIVPLVVLEDETAEKCRDLGLDTKIWQPSDDLKSIESTQVLITGVERSVHVEFQQILVQLDASGRLARLVIDECHSSASDDKYRQVMQRLPKVVRCVPRVPVLLMSATLPVSLQDKLQEMFKFPDLKVIRAGTNRPELRFDVLDVSENVHSIDDLNDLLVKRLHSEMRILRWLQTEGRVIIYCLKTNWAEELAAVINRCEKREICGVYHSKLKPEARKENLDRWKRGDITVLTATGALGAGVHRSDVRLVIHQVFGSSLVDFVQQVGRAGRDGKTARCLTVFSNNFDRETGWLDEEERNQMIAWVRTNECTDCLSSPGCVLCCVCEKLLEMTVEEPVTNLAYTGVKRGRGSEPQEIRDSRNLKSILANLKNVCLYCWTLEKPEARNHSFFKCRYLVNKCLACQSTGHSAKTCAARPYYKKGTCCVTCGFPQRAFGEDIHGNPQTGECSEGIRDILKGVCWSIYRDSQLRKKWFDTLGLGERMDEKGFKRWIEARDHSGEMVNGARLVLEVWGERN